MSKSIIQQLYGGEVNPFEKINYNIETYQCVRRNISAEKLYFKESLSEEQQEHFEKLDDLYCEQSGIHCYEHFKYALKLGMMLAFEVLTNKEEHTKFKE